MPSVTREVWFARIRITWPSCAPRSSASPLCTVTSLPPFPSLMTVASAPGLMRVVLPCTSRVISWLLATPVTQRDKHLEVLAELAKAVGADPNVQRQLYNATSAAHAYDLLHAEESEGFNYFLEDEAAS